MRKGLLNLGVEDSLGENLLGDLGSHVGIRKLGGNEDSSNLLFLNIDLVDFHLNTALGDIEDLVVLAEEFIITFLSRLKTRESNRHVVSGGTSASLRIEEKTGSVGRGVEVTSHLETRLEGSSVALGLEVLDGEEERNALTSRELDGGGSVINTLLFVENNVSSGDVDVSFNSLKGVGLTGHDLGVDEFLLGLSSLSNFFFDGPGLGLNAHVDKLLSSLRGDGSLSNDFGATVGKTSSLHLQVGELVELALGKGLGRGNSKSESNNSGKGSLSGVGKIILHGHLELGAAL